VSTANSVSFKVVVCALIALTPNALLLYGFDVTTAQAQASAQTSLTGEPSVDSSTGSAVLVD
jgi:hypothetical protein